MDVGVLGRIEIVAAGEGEFQAVGRGFGGVELEVRLSCRPGPSGSSRSSPGCCR